MEETNLNLKTLLCYSLKIIIPFLVYCRCMEGEGGEGSIPPPGSKRELPRDPQELQRIMGDISNRLDSLDEKLLAIDSLTTEEAITLAIMRAEGEGGYAACSSVLAELQGREEDAQEAKMYSQGMIAVIDAAREGNFTHLRSFITRTAESQYDLANDVSEDDAEMGGYFRRVGNKYIELVDTIPESRPQN